MNRGIRVLIMIMVMILCTSMNLSIAESNTDIRFSDKLAVGNTYTWIINDFIIDDQVQTTTPDYTEGLFLVGSKGSTIEIEVKKDPSTVNLVVNNSDSEGIFIYDYFEIRLDGKILTGYQAWPFISANDYKGYEILFGSYLFRYILPTTYSIEEKTMDIESYIQWWVINNAYNEQESVTMKRNGNELTYSLSEDNRVDNGNETQYVEHWEFIKKVDLETGITNYFRLSGQVDSNIILRFEVQRQGIDEGSDNGSLITSWYFIPISFIVLVLLKRKGKQFEL